VSDSILDRLRDIVLFIAGAMAIVSLILSLYEGFNQRIGTASFLAGLFVASTLIVFLPKLEVFKAWGVEARLTKTLDRAEEIIGKLRRLSLISAKASYMNAAWSNRMASPSTKEKQAMLDEVDQQLTDLNVSKAERDGITEPFVQIIGFDLYQMFAKIIHGYAAPKYSALIAKANASQKEEDQLALVRHSERIGVWTKRTQNPHLFSRLKTYSLKEELERELPNENEWMSDSERAIAEKFKNRVLELFEGCKKKGGYTPEAADFMDRFPEEREQVVQGLFGEELKKIK
jgi:hypothetical protein